MIEIISDKELGKAPALSNRLSEGRYSKISRQFKAYVSTAANPDVLFFFITVDKLNPEDEDEVDKRYRQYRKEMVMEEEDSFLRFAIKTAYEPKEPEFIPITDRKVGYTAHDSAADYRMNADENEGEELHGQILNMPSNRLSKEVRKKDLNCPPMVAFHFKKNVDKDYLIRLYDHKGRPVHIP